MDIEEDDGMHEVDEDTDSGDFAEEDDSAGSDDDDDDDE
jgi:hypothetical protein